MRIDTTALMAILGMAAVTYFTRISGLWMMNRMKATPRMEAWLRALPGTILTSIIAPSVLTSGPAEILSGLATVLVAWCSKNLVAAMVVGVFCVWGLRHFFA